MLLWSFEGCACGYGRDAGVLTIWAVIAVGVHLFTFRTEKLSPPAPMVLGAQAPGRVGRRPILHEGRRKAAFGVRRLRPVVLRGSDLVLRPWTEGDVAALVAACNDTEITRWIPVIPSQYTEEDALAFVRGEIRPDLDYSFAITSDGNVVGSIGMGLNSMGYRGRIGYWVAATTLDRKSVV